MIFSVDGTFDKVKNGTKDITRRPVKKGDQFEHEDGKIVKVIREGRVLWEVGKDYAVTLSSPEDGTAQEQPDAALLDPGRGETGVGRMLILSLEIDPNPGYMAMEEAQREGFDHPDEFKDAWIAMYDDVALWRPAYRIEFEYLPPSPPHPTASLQDRARGTKEKEPEGEDTPTSSEGSAEEDPSPATPSGASKPIEASR